MVVDNLMTGFFIIGSGSAVGASVTTGAVVAAAAMGASGFTMVCCAHAVTPIIIALTINKTNNFFISFFFPNTGGAAVSGGTLEHCRYESIYRYAAARESMEYPEGLRVEEVTCKIILSYIKKSRLCR